MILLLSETDVSGILSMADGIRVVEHALRQHAQGDGIAIPRLSADVPGKGGAFRVMPAILPPAGFFGLKTLTGYPGRRTAGETYFVLLLFSCEGGALRAIVAGNRLTGIRTGAATGVAAKYLARNDAHVLGIIGAGAQARYQVSALREVCPVTDVRVYDIDETKAAVFAREIALDFQIPARAVGEAREAVAGCDLVVTVTAATSPVFDASWLEPGTHLSAVGSNAPNKCEVGADAFARCRTVVDFGEQARQEAGDLQRALASGTIRPDAIDELGEVILGRKPGRRDARELTLFKSVGMAIEDVATASFAYQQALAAGIGRFVELDGVDSRPAALARASAGQAETSTSAIGG
jgi:alanine dehydrogenase